jgi:hypothetical protein
MLHLKFRFSKSMYVLLLCEPVLQRAYLFTRQVWVFWGHICLSTYIFSNMSTKNCHLCLDLAAALHLQSWLTLFIHEGFFSQSQLVRFGRAQGKPELGSRCCRSQARDPTYPRLFVPFWWQRSVKKPMARSPPSGCSVPAARRRGPGRRILTRGRAGGSECGIGQATRNDRREMSATTTLLVRGI